MSKERIPIRFELIEQYPGVTKNKTAVRAEKKKERRLGFSTVYFVIGDSGRVVQRTADYFLPKYWKPVYEEKEEVEKKYNLPYTSINGTRGFLTLTIKGNKVHYGKYSFSADTLETVLMPNHAISTGENREAIPFTPTVFDMGCVGQYKHISNESIQELIKMIRSEESNIHFFSENNILLVRKKNSEYNQKVKFQLNK